MTFPNEEKEINTFSYPTLIESYQQFRNSNRMTRHEQEWMRAGQKERQSWCLLSCKLWTLKNKTLENFQSLEWTCLHFFQWVSTYCLSWNERQKYSFYISILLFGFSSKCAFLIRWVDRYEFRNDIAILK